MLCNILITGSNGFIGQRLLQTLANKRNINILKFNRKDPLSVLEESLINCDFIFHLAGEVRPNSNKEKFVESNVSLTKFIINTLINKNKSVPILLTSSVHAEFLKNDYGKTKRDSELLIETYSKKHNINCFIYRLPHVFGEGCKINYNSVITTWIYNSINNLDIKIFDRNIEMNYVYVQDIVEEFLLKLTSEYSTKLYFEPINIYETNLGEVVDFIFEFKLNILNENYKIIENPFKEKLFQTYKDYYGKKMYNQNNKMILLTGTAGFIGSNFVPYFLDKYPEYNLINLDLLTYAGNLENLRECESNPRYTFIKGDISNRELVEFIFTEYDIRGVIHFAAESHVDNSIKNPGVFINTNVHGTFTLIDVAYKYWMDKPFNYKEKYNNCRFHHISTDEVYGTLTDDPEDLFTEMTPYAPNSPYSASKASSDMIIRAYNETYGINTVITNCSNNYGPKQHDEKLIPTIIRKALNNESIPIYGDGKNIRDWLYVLDHCKGIDLVYHTGKIANTYNIGGKNERTNLEIVDTICSILDNKVPSQTLNSYKELITFVEDRAGHDRRYAIDASKLEIELGWKSDENFDTGIVKTLNWYIEKYKGVNIE